MVIIMNQGYEKAKADLAILELNIKEFMADMQAKMENGEYSVVPTIHLKELISKRNGLKRDIEDFEAAQYNTVKKRLEKAENELVNLIKNENYTGSTKLSRLDEMYKAYKLQLEIAVAEGVEE